MSLPSGLGGKEDECVDRLGPATACWTPPSGAGAVATGPPASALSRGRVAAATRGRLPGISAPVGRPVP